jgi:hypothetical protein
MKQADIKFTYHDYLQLPDDKRYELVEGELPCPQPVPSTNPGKTLDRNFDTHSA